MEQASMFDPISRPEVQLRRDASEAEVRAANQALAASGNHREYAFYQIWRRRPYGATTVEVAYAWAEANPCADCGCTHRLPVPVNQWGARFLELRESGYVAELVDDTGEPVVREFDGRPGIVHVVTESGRREGYGRYGP